MSQLSIHQQEHRRKRRNWLLLRLGIILFFILAIFFGLVFLSRMQKFRITTVELSGEVLVVPDEVVFESGNFLSGYYIGLFPRNNFLIFPQSALQKFLKEKFKRIDTIQTKLSGFKKLEIIITERKQQALWCTSPAGSVSPGSSPSDISSAGSAPPDSASSGSLSEKCYFLDDNGLIFSEAPNFSGDAYFKYYGGVNGDSPIGQTYLSTSTVFQEVSSFVQSVRQTVVTPVSVLVGNDGQFTMFLSSGGKIYFNQPDSLSKTADDLKVLLQTLSVSSSTSISNINYIDLRFGNKLFYKLK
jgi:hypothetical protein